MTKTRVLCVDDEPQVIDGLVLLLRRDYEVVAAHSGAEGLSAIRERGPFAVVLSDMRMPGMDGAAFLQRAREEAPDATRMLLTGHADIESAIAAVNHGQIFRFLTKPCPPNELRLAFEAATAQYRLVTAEKVLLAQTLIGCIQALTDILSITSPLVFGKTTRIRDLAIDLCKDTPTARRWVVESAAMLSHLGCIVVPDKVVRKQEAGELLSDQEQAMIAKADALTASILDRIPRLEPVRQVIAMIANPSGKIGKTSQEVATEAAILRLAKDFDDLESQGMSPQVAVDTMRGRGSMYDIKLLDMLAASLRISASNREIREIAIRELRAGMVLARDAYLNNGTLLVARGYKMTAAVIERIRNFDSVMVKEPLRVIMPTDSGANGALPSKNNGGNP